MQCQCVNNQVIDDEEDDRQKGVAELNSGYPAVNAFGKRHETEMLE